MTCVNVEPIDPRRCQAEHRIGNFMSFGPQRFERCHNQPVWIAAQSTPDADGFRGGMSLCADCRDKLEQQEPGMAFFLPLLQEEGAS